MFGRLLCLLGLHSLSKEKQSLEETYTVYPCRRFGCFWAEIRRNPYRGPWSETMGNKDRRPTSWREIG